MPGRKADEKKKINRSAEIFQFYYGTLLGRPVLH